MDFDLNTSSKFLFLIPAETIKAYDSYENQGKNPFF